MERKGEEAEKIRSYLQADQTDHLFSSFKDIIKQRVKFQSSLSLLTSKCFPPLLRWCKRAIDAQSKQAIRFLLAW